MAGLINKVKEAVTGTSHTTDNDDYDNTRGSGLTGSGTQSSDAYGSDNRGTSNTGYGSTDTSTGGPHSSNVGNQVDPRVDSDGSRGISGRDTDTSGYTGSTGASTTRGPHSSDLANKADPRVDSDGSRGISGRDTNTSGYSGSTGSSNTAGPHSSDLANKVDPRVDSDRDGSRGYDSSNTSGTYGSGTSGQGLTGRVAGLTGHGGTTGVHGHVEDIVHGGDHYTATANKLDPHVSGGGRTEGLASSGTGLSYGSTSDTGHSQGSREPHQSSLLNKVDPRVRSDNDGSNTYGGNQTTTSGQPLDAATTKPSVFVAHHGDPTPTKVADDLRKYGNGIE